jgi:hypothetical protein
MSEARDQGFRIADQIRIVGQGDAVGARRRDTFGASQGAVDLHPWRGLHGTGRLLLQAQRPVLHAGVTSDVVEDEPGHAGSAVRSSREVRVVRDDQYRLIVEDVAAEISERPSEGVEQPAGRRFVNEILSTQKTRKHASPPDPERKKKAG